MIISHRHRFIFVHCRKTGGSALKAYLNRFLGAGDVQIGAWPASIAAGGRPTARFAEDVAMGLWQRPQRIAGLLKAARPTKGAKRRFFVVLNSIHKTRYPFGNPAHPTAAEAEAFAPQAWRDYAKFCVVRNPYEKAVSDYVYAQSSGIEISFLAFLRDVADPARPDALVLASPTNWPMYTIDDEVAVDHVCRYETLGQDLARVLGGLGLPFDASEMPVVKKFKEYDYGDYYGSEEKRLVKLIYEKELRHFGYSF